MNRRQFVQSIVFAGAVSALPVLTSPQPSFTKIGRVTPETHRGRVRVFLDGVDVTNSSYAADDVAGYVDMYVRDANSKIRIFHGDAMQERKYGNVRIELIEDQS